MLRLTLLYFTLGKIWLKGYQVSEWSKVLELGFVTQNISFTKNHQIYQIITKQNWEMDSSIYTIHMPLINKFMPSRIAE